MKVFIIHKFYGDEHRFADLRWAGFLPQMLMRRTEVLATTKLSAENETPPIANVLLWAGFYCPDVNINTATKFTPNAIPKFVQTLPCLIFFDF